MTYHSYRKQKNGRTSVYEVESSWEKELKAPKNRQRYLGRLDEKTGRIIPSKGLDPVQGATCDLVTTATTTIVGPS